MKTIIMSNLFNNIHEQSLLAGKGLVCSRPVYTDYIGSRYSDSQLSIRNKYIVNRS